MQGRVLVIAGSDSGGGAGIQADIKTVTALGGYAMTAITALTAQDTRGVSAIHDVPPDFVAAQARVVLADIGADCVKIGMLHTPEVIEIVAAVVAAEASGIPVVLDPVMVAKGGAPLLRADAVERLRETLLPRATVLTPNIPEAETLAGRSIRDRGDMEAAGRALLAQGPDAVLVKGGHLSGDVVYDALVSADGTRIFESPRIDTSNTHGTGCTLASAIATGIAQGLALADSVARARAYVIEAIRSAPGLGHGHGPLNHGLTVRPFRAARSGEGHDGSDGGPSA